MQYQIYRLRDGSGMTLVPQLQVEDPRILFTTPIAEQLPESERFNLYFTVAKSVGAREPVERELLHFDVDNILDADPDKIFEVAASTIGCDPKKTAAVMSGNGVQFFVLLAEPITDPKYIDDRKETYALMAEAINMALKKEGLKGDADLKVWDPKRVMRLPWTKNIKPKKPEAYARVMQPNLSAQANPIEAWHKQVADERVPLSQFKKYPTPDTEAILKGCEFLKFCEENAETLEEQHWFREVGITAHLPNGSEITHARSAKHPKYSRRETQGKIDRALKVGPMTCKGIQAHWQKCGICKYFKDNLATPLLIHGEDYIRTKDTGFYTVTYGENGAAKYTPNFEDLEKHYIKTCKPMRVGDRIYHWNGTHYEYQEGDTLLVFAGDNFKPAASMFIRREFEGRVLSSSKIKGQPLNVLSKEIEQKANFKNGVLDLKTMKLEPHSQKYFFRGVLPYEYDPEAKAPRFERYLREVTQDDEESVLLLKEFGGYCLSGDDYWEQKALFLTGTGKNGKSKYTELLPRLVGKENYSSISLSKFSDGNHAVMMDGKLFNICDEAPTYALNHPDIFKRATGGEGELTGFLKYKDNYQFKNKAKIVVSCNNLPMSSDKTYALLRRILIVNFVKTFEGDEEDKFIMRKFEAELPGIFNSMIEAYLAAKKRGHLTFPKGSIKSLESYQVENDTTYEFVKYELTVHPTFGDKEGIKRSDLYQKYKFFHEMNGEGKPVGRTRFYTLLKSHIKDLDKRTKKVRVGKDTDWYVLGIEVAKSDEEF